MDILEFITTQYPIRDKVMSKLSNPYDRVANNDDLPYDLIGRDESGHVTKLVEVEENRFISVVDLLSYSREDVDKLNDPALMNVWENYMASIDICDMNIVDILECTRTHQKSVERRAEQLGVLSI